ncbi:hypothetical protein SAMN04487965_1209 [Microbulbifer donghaiensis]|uniref:Uncharacterized protein n=1 Tax=Microbulbifer donghaiensis TaxID=494016 RepID=A0A1M4YBV6_9GAMM|nr:hypothetical protein [Microbulbifer donghaiensis]SHF03217.1 hypothetical protein SAMN04487965_1209 [Microbulbifer donghaiensis]
MRLISTLAQGRYHYSCDGREMPVQDSWQLGEDDEGVRTLVSQRLVGEQGFGMEVRARLREGLVSECRVCWRDEVDEVNAHYRLRSADGEAPKLGDLIEVDWTGPNGPQQATVAGRGRLLFPLMRIFMGPLLLKLEQFTDGLEVVTPDIVDPSQRGKLLAPRVSHRSARPMVGDIAIPRTQELGPDISAYIYQGDEAERDAHCYVNSRGLLVGYDWPSSTGRLWQVRLRDLEWSPQLLGINI